MNEIEESQTTESLNKTLPIFGIGLFLIVLFLIIYEYYDLGSDQYNGEQLVTLNVTASDTPKYIRYSKREKERYTLKAQEFNGHFWIITSGLEMVRNDIVLKEKVETIQRGDKLQFDIYESERKFINGLYYKAPLLGLAINGKTIFSPKQIEQSDKQKRNKFIKNATIFDLGIFIALLIWRIKK